MMNLNVYKLILLALSASILVACESDPDTDLQESIVESTAISNYDPSNSVIPFPNDLLFADSADGTLNIPVVDEDDLSDPQVALNGLDGFSTIAPITTAFTGEIQAASLSGDSIKLYEVTLSTTPQPGGPAVAINDELTYGVDFVGSVSSVDSSGQSLAIVPLKPLNASSAYYVVITNELTSSDGNQMGVSGAYALSKLTTPLVDGGISQNPALSDAEATSLEPLRLITSTSEATLAAFDTTLDTGDIIMSWLFSTQSIGNVLTQVRTDIRGGAVPGSVLVDSAADSALGAADIWIGSVTVPYYLTAATGANDSTPLASFWQGAAGSNLSRFNPGVVKTSDQTIPLMVSVPKSVIPAAGYPVVIYQHGITSNRATMLAVADAFASAGLAVVAIDMPLHGLTGDETNGTEDFYGAFPGVGERTFDLDLVDNDTSAAGPDNVTDTSGKHFINLTNLLNTRDNLRQSVSDLFALTYAVGNMTAGAATFDETRIYFLGHSLGAIVGTTFTALESNVRDAAFAFGGGSLPKVLDGSAAFSPTIVAGLEASGVIKGTADYESFIGAAQTVVDSGDSVNYAATLAAKTQGILYFEIQGGNASPSDLVVPNTVPDSNDTSGLTVAAPLAGTEPMLELLGLTQVNSDQAGADLKHSIKFAVGNHSSLLSADADDFNTEATNTLVRVEIQTLAATFLASDGAAVDVTDDTLLQAPSP